MKFSIQYLITLFLFFSLSLGGYAQKKDTLPYREISDYPDRYNAVNMASRIVDGLGFRFYWATEGLREKDLAFRPTEEARNVEETIDHILSMTFMLLNAIEKSSESPKEELSFEQKRRLALTNLKVVSNKLRKSNVEDLESYSIKLSNGKTLPFWNLINGPSADCIWHCGQISSFRRLSGNPINAKVSFLRGKVRD